MGTLLVAHGTRNPRGVRMIGDLAAAVSAQGSGTVRVAFVDVVGPSPSEVLTDCLDEAMVVVPAFLSSGFHVRSDVPREVALSGHGDVVISDPLGPSPELARAMLSRLRAAGWLPGDAVVMAAAGTRDRHAQSQIRTMATTLSATVGVRVQIAFAAPPADESGYPSVDTVVRRCRAQGQERVAVASYLLADGLFQERLRASTADVVADPLGLHPNVVRLVCSRQFTARHAGSYAALS